MSQRVNEYDQPIGEQVDCWSLRAEPQKNIILEGRYTIVEGLNSAKHADELYEAFNKAQDGRYWTYMPFGPFNKFTDFKALIDELSVKTDSAFYAVLDKKLGKAVGFFSLMRIDVTNGVIEVGNVAFSPLLQKTRSSTEAQFLLMSYVFDKLQYRRYEWKCDSLNGPSQKAALRLGFQYEGLFRQNVIYKGRSRDTAWFSIINVEWPIVKQAIDIWLSELNFDADGQQFTSLELST